MHGVKQLGKVSRGWREDAQPSTRDRRGRSDLKRTASVAVIGLLALCIGSAAWGQTPRPVVELAYPEDNPTGEVVIGEQFTFIVRFWNEAPADTGYVPFVDLFLEYPGKDCSSQSEKCDGIKFIGAYAKFSSPKKYDLDPVPLGQGNLANACGIGSDCPGTAPIAAHPFGAWPPPSGLDGYQLTVLRLPPGQMVEYDPSTNQGEVPIEIVVTAEVSDFADHGIPLTVYARGGFAQDGVPAVQDELQELQFTPLAFKVTKKYNGPHDDVATNCPCKHKIAETVPGPHHTGTYTVRVDVAEGHSIKNLILTDFIPVELQYVASSVSVPSSMTVSQAPSSTQPGGALKIEHVSNWVGVAGVDFLITFDVYPTDVAMPDCEPIIATNQMFAEADWMPKDPRDVCAASNGWCHVSAGASHDLVIECAVLRKSVELIKDPEGCGFEGTAPGDRLRYTIEFAFSDYASLAGISILDVLSIGQHLDPSSVELTISDGDLGGPHSVPLTGHVETTEAPFLYACPTSKGQGTIFAGTRVVFLVSDAIAAALGASVTIGSPDMSSPMAAGTITFEVEVLDEYEDMEYFTTSGVPYCCGTINFLPRNEEVDKLDPLLNCALLTAVRVDVSPAVMTANSGFSCQGIPNPEFRKSVYRVYRVSTGETIYENQDPWIYSGAEAATDDWVTFRLYKEIPSCDAEMVTITDWLPSGAFDVGGVWTQQSGLKPGTWEYGPHHTAPQSAIVSTSASDNSLTFGLGTFTDDDDDEPTPNCPCTIDILFTVQVKDKPFDDETTVCNVAQECENSSISGGSCQGGSCPATGGGVCQMALAELKLRAPKLRISKAVVAVIPKTGMSIPSYGEFSGIIPVDFYDPCDQSVPAFNTAKIVDSWFSSTVMGVDHDDILRFAIVVENLGGAAAFDVSIKDTLPSDFIKPGCWAGQNPYGVTVTDGTGAAIPHTGDLFGVGLVLTDPGAVSSNDAGALDAKAATSPGRNVAVITFDVKLAHSLDIGDCRANRATLASYAAKEGGTDYVSEGFGGPFLATNEVCIRPTAHKCILCTSEPDTVPDATDGAAPVDATIGEIIRYRLVTSLPETTYDSLKIVDTIPDDFDYINGSARACFVYDKQASLTASNLTSVNAPWTWQPGGGCLAAIGAKHFVTISPSVTSNAGTTSNVLTFSFGKVVNGDDDPNREYLIIEFDALVRNDGIQAGDQIQWNVYTVGNIGSNPVGIRIVEASLTIDKVTTWPNCDTDQATFSITLTNVGTAPAYDIQLTDSACAASSKTWTLAELQSGASHSFTWTTPLNSSCCDCANEATVTYSSLPGTHGTSGPCTASAVPGAPGSTDGERTYGPTTKLFDLCGRIRGEKFHDVNADGVRDASEPGLSGWTIVATHTVTGCEYHEDTIGLAGYYEFCVPPGTYEITEIQQPGWNQSAPASTQTVTVAAGATVTGPMFGNYQCVCASSSPSSPCKLTVTWPSGSRTVEPPATLPKPAEPQIHPGDAISVDFVQGCGCTPSAGCPVHYWWNLYQKTAQGYMPVVPTTYEPQLPITFAPPDDCTSGTYRFGYTCSCGGTPKEPNDVCCQSYVDLIVSCECEEWDEPLILQTPYESWNVACGDTVSDIPLVHGDSIRLDASFSCTPACCGKEVSWKVCKHSSLGTTGTVLTEGIRLPVEATWLETYGWVAIELSSSCGGTACPPCAVRLEILENADCTCVPSETLEVAWPGGSGSVACDGWIDVAVDCADEIEIASDWMCDGSKACDELSPAFSWVVFDLEEDQGMLEGTTHPIRFDPPRSGVYQVTLQGRCPYVGCPSCSTCDPCTIELRVEETTCDCECGMWGTLTVSDADAPGTGWQQQIECGDSLDLAAPVERVEVVGEFDCAPTQPQCSPVYAWEVVMAGTSDVWGSGVCYTDPCRFWFIPVAGAYEVTIVPSCGNRTCEPCTFTLSTAVPSSCGQWVDLDDDSMADFLVEGMPTPVEGRIRLEMDDLDGPLTIEPSYRCAAGAGNPGFRWTVTGPGGFVLRSGSDEARGLVEFYPPTAGEYRATFRPSCQGEPGVEHRVTVVVEGSSGGCSCSRWGVVEVNGQAIACGERVAVTVDGWFRVDMGRGYNCPDAGCAATYAWELYGPEGHRRLDADRATWIRVGQEGEYWIMLTPYCGETACPECMLGVVARE